MKSDKHIKATITKNSKNFFSFKAWAAFNQLQNAFSKAWTLHHFDLKCHINIESDVFGFAIGGMLSQLLLSSYHITQKRVQNHSTPNLPSKNG